jgi:hypothetical protein
MRNETKIAIAVRDDLAPWQKLNVTAFLSSGLVGAYPELRGEAYRDGSGRVSGPPVRQPILIFAASGEDLTRALSRARERGLRCCIYTHDLFSIGNDADNRAAVEAVATEALDLVGLALHAERKEVDKVSKGLRLHL